MNTKHARYMLTVLQEGSITAAAKKLYISQPSLSQMIKLVENNLGTPIFNRNTDPISLTFAGQKYIEAARKILAIDNNLQKEIAEINHEEYGKIRLGIPVQRAIEVLPYALPRFLEKYPHVAVSVQEEGSAIIETAVREGNVDLACLTTYPRHEELNYILVEKEVLVLLCGKNTEIARRIPNGTPITASQAVHEKFVCIKDGHSVRATQDRLFAANDLHPEIVLETESIEVGKRTAIALNAAMICPLNYIQMSPELLPDCVTYPLLGVENSRNFYICHRKDLYLTKYMRDFIEILKQRTVL